MNEKYLIKKEELMELTNKKIKNDNPLYILIEADTLASTINNLNSDKYDILIINLNEIIMYFEKDFASLENKEIYLNLLLKNVDLNEYLNENFSYEDYEKIITINIENNIKFVFNDFEDIFSFNNIKYEDNNVNVLYDFSKRLIISNIDKKYQLLYIFECNKNIISDLIENGLDEKKATEITHNDFKIHWDILLNNLK